MRAERGADGGSACGESARLGHEDAVYTTLWQDVGPYIAEFVGVFLLTVVFFMNSLDSSNPEWRTTSNGAMNAVLVYCFLHVSGANLNPSVTISLTLAGRHTPRVALKLCLAQLLGACSAAALQFRVSPPGAALHFGPHPGFGWSEVAGTEILFTGMLCFVYLNCAASLKNNPVGDPNGFVGLAMGFCFIAAGTAGREISNNVMNSAVAAGTLIVDCREGFRARSLTYLLFDVAGAFLGTGLYRVVRPEEAGAEPEGFEGLARRVSAEFAGTFYVVLTQALNRIGRGAPGPEAWSVGAAVAAMTCAVGDISGAHLSPAVTTAVWATRRGLEAYELLWRVLGQVLAGTLATAMFAWLNHGSEIKLTFAEGYGHGAAAAVECAFTFLTCYVVLATGTLRPVRSKTKQNNIAGLAYGGCHIVGGISIGNISGGLLNPVVVLLFNGLKLFDLEFRSNVILYIFWELIGALLASAAFFLTHAHVYRSEVARPGPPEGAQEA